MNSPFSMAKNSAQKMTHGNQTPLFVVFFEAPSCYSARGVRGVQGVVEDVGGVEAKDLQTFPHEVGLSENVVYPIVPNGFADHYPVMKNG